MSTVNGTIMGDFLAGTNGNDEIYGYGGADALAGTSAMDSLYGG